MSAPEYSDVIVAGGGLAGLTLALQLKQRMPALSITVVERRKHPVPHGAHKVGESSVEIGAHYFENVLGLRLHGEIEPTTPPGVEVRPSGDDEFELRLHVERVGSTSVGWSWSVVCDEATCIEGRHTTVHVGEDGAPEPVRPELRTLLADPTS